MAITYIKALSHIRHTLGGELSPDLDPTSIMNDAGHFMTAMYPWKWLEEISGAITPSDASMVDISTSIAPGFVELIGYGPRATDSRLGAAVDGYSLVTPAELLDIRTTAMAMGAYSNYFAVVYDDDSVTAVAPNPVVKLDFEIGSSATANLKILYRRGWLNITADTGIFIMPEWMEPVYTQCLRSFARGYEEEDVATLGQRLTDIRSGPLALAALERDPRVQNFKRHRLGPQPDWNVPGTHAMGEVRS